MGILASRVDNILRFPEPYIAVALPAAQCDEIVELFISRKTAGGWTVGGEFDTADLIPDDVREWLKSVEIHDRVDIVWVAHREGLRLQFDTFVQFYDDLWFPSSDDVVILSLDGMIALTLSHEEVFTWFLNAV